MKRVILLTIFLLSIFSVYATHEYIPLLSPDNVWVESCYQAYAQYAISDRIDINGAEYCVVSRTEMSLPDKDIVANNQKLYIREEGKRVYRYDDAFAQEYLLFDFGVKEGDIIDSSISSENKRHIVVDSIRSVMLDAKEHNAYYVTYFVNEERFLNDIWIEGIGSTQTFLFNDVIRWGGSGYSYFNYFYNKNTQYIYPEDATLYDFGTSSTHEYIPYVREGNAWVIIGGEGYKQFSIGQEVVIDNKSYYELNYAFFKPSKGCVTNRSLYDYIWEHDKKVYLGTDTQNRLLYDFGAQVLDTIRYDHLDESFYYYTVVNSVSTQEILGKQRLVMNVSHYCSVDDFNDPIQSSWIEGIGAINEDIFDFEKSYRMGASATPDQFYYYTNSNEGGCYPEVQKVIDFSAISTINTDAFTLTLHRSGDVLMATFPTAGKGEAITLYDATGRVVTTQPIREGATTTSIDVATLPDGIYIARLSNGATAKVVL